MKYWQIPGSEYPTWTIDLSKLELYTDITDIMLQLGVERYVYAFVFKKLVIKYGISTKNHTGPAGERIYRQAGHLEGWSNRLHGPSGADMRIIDQDYFDKYGEHLNRNEMVLIIMDLTNVENPHVSDPDWPCKVLERKLIKEYTNKTGSPPIGNKDTESYIDGKGYVAKDTWDNLFHVD